MNSDPSAALGNVCIGVGGTLLAFVTPEKAGIFAGLATGTWMFWQLGCSVYDRLKGRNKNVPNRPV